MIRNLLLCLAFLTMTGSALAAVEGHEVDYSAGDGTTLKGYLAVDPARTGKHPGILVVHEWWGLNAYARKRAEMLAAMGYTALAVDMYGDGKTAIHPETAGKFSSAVSKDLPLAKKRFLAGLDLLKQQPGVDPDRIAAIGYCFGGGIVLAMARAGVDVDGVVSFHGSLGTGAPAEPGQVKARILVLTGADDPFVPPEQVAAFREEMTKAGADFQLISYPGAKHSFTNPDADAYGQKFNLPLAYNAKVDQESWQAMADFFQRIFSSPAPR